MQWFRKVLFWIHLVVGVTAGAAVLLMSVTGVLLTYQRQMVAWADMRAHEVSPPAGGARLPAGQLIARAREAEGGVPTTLTVRRNPRAPAEVAYGREKTVFVNPYTGQVLGHGSAGIRRFFAVVTDWHRWLGRSGESRAWGKGIMDAANLGFLFLVLSGFYLWWPRRWTKRAFRNVLWYRRGLRPKARDFNWHNVTGIWGVIPLVVVVASGVVISYPWASNAVYRIYGEKPPARSGPPGEGPGAQGRAAGGAASAAG
ncbi:MAG TPA: PepSY-associated TM helix domain-containing protein, partial [Longimicrobium sp.]|nr:PepSY-associated TM helix domain-containing protein [Longimicrobium sp.]